MSEYESLVSYFIKKQEDCIEKHAAFIENPERFFERNERFFQQPIHNIEYLSRFFKKNDSDF
jgi:transposase